MAQTVADVLVGVLEQVGVQHIFGLIGDSLNPLADAVRRSKIEWIGVRHEEGAALAAAGQAKLPHRVLMTEDVFDIDLLQELNREVGCLRIHVVDDGLLLFRRGRQHGRDNE